MVKVWEKAKFFKPEKANVSTWVFAIARNCRIDYLRKMKRITSPLTADDLWPVFEEPEPEDLTDLAKSGQQIEKIVDNLPAEQVEILREVYIEGKTHAEVSKQTGLPLGTVKSRLRLAMEKLRVNLAADQNPVAEPAEPTRTTTN
jgi:RNA polymerase sigma-70 factor (ECF subfamily)